jgi:predicted nucleotidyltransferase
MPSKRTEIVAPIPSEPTRSAGVCMDQIRELARQIAERFHPEKIILFGSYAYGQPDEGSDVDLLVIMPARNMIDQSVKIRLALPPRPFPLDLIVRTPEYVRRRLAGEDWFLREIVGKGKVLYEDRDQGVGPQGRDGLADGARPRRDRGARP